MARNAAALASAIHEPAGASVDPLDDRRIADLFALVDSGDYDLLSLDVFDTVVHREALRPTDVFIELGAKLVANGRLLPSSSAESFARERQMAEGRARGKVAGHEATLQQIWAEFPRGYLTGITREEGMRLELETEQQHLRVYEPMRALLEHARAKRMRTAFVSDTYFTATQIAALTGLRPDFTIVSCEHGRPKARGLHAVLLEKSRIPAARILHAGDDRTADVEGPAAFGIARYWFRRFPQGFGDMIAHELPGTFSQRAALVAHGDAGMTALRSHAMSACTDEAARWGAGVLGPVLAGYAEWVRERCAASGVTHVLCLMREGRVLKEVLDALDGSLVTHETFVSRFVALQASIFTGTFEELARFVRRPSATVARKVLGQLGLAPDDVPGLDADAPLAPRDVEALCRRISAAPELRRKVVQHSARVRAGLLAHLRPMLPKGPHARVACVDLGYKGTIQAGLQRIFDHERLGVQTHGLYVVTGGEVHETQSEGAIVEGWLAENGQPVAMAHTFMRSPEIFEQGLMADCGSTLGHAEDGTPVLDETHVPADQRAQIAAIQRGVQAFVTRWNAYRAQHGAADGATLRGLCRGIAIRSIARPAETELALFAHWNHDENFGSGAVRTLTDPVGLHPWERAHLSPHQLASLPHTRLYWPFGFAWQRSRAFGEAVAQIFLRTCEPWAFESGHGRIPMRFYWDFGGGFSAEDSALEDCAFDTRGRSWHRAGLRLRGEALRAVAFAFASPGDVVRIAGARLHWRHEDGRLDSVDVAPEQLELASLDPLAPGLWRVSGDTALVLVPAAAPPAFRGSLDTDLFLTLLPEDADA